MLSFNITRAVIACRDLTFINTVTTRTWPVLGEHTLILRYTNGDDQTTYCDPSEVQAQVTCSCSMTRYREPCRRFGDRGSVRHKINDRLGCMSKTISVGWRIFAYQSTERRPPSTCRNGTGGSCSVRVDARRVECDFRTLLHHNQSITSTLICELNEGRQLAKVRVNLNIAELINVSRDCSDEQIVNLLSCGFAEQGWQWNDDNQLVY